MNLSKCELFWPSGDSFPEFSSDIKRVSGLELLGSPLWGDDSFFKDFLSSRIDKVALTQDKLSILDDSQVELHLLRSCLSQGRIQSLERGGGTLLKKKLKSKKKKKKKVVTIIASYPLPNI